MATIDLGRAAGSIRKIESGSYTGNYGALGPVSPKTGDRAFGAYQVMGANVPQWTEKHYGEALTPQQFLGNKEAQDKVFQGEFGGYVNRFGSGEAASQAWLGGPGSVGKTARTDFTGTSVGTYSSRYSTGYADPNNGGTFSNGSAPGEVGQANGISNGNSVGGTNGLDLNGATKNADGSYTLSDGSSTLPEIKDGADPNSTGSQGGSGTSPQQTTNATSSDDGGSSGGGGFGAFMTDVGRAVGNALAPATAGAGKAVASATKDVAKATTQSGTTIAKGSTDAAAATVAQSKADTTIAADSFKDYFGRFVVILLGLIFVAGGIAMFVFNKDPVKLAANIIKGK